MKAGRNATRRTPVILACVLSLAVSAPALADGIAFKGHDISSWLSLLENEQVAAIHHADGVEKMILAINVDLKDETDQALWIVPVPGTPDNVGVSIGDKFPRFFGYDPRQVAWSNIGVIATLLRATQGYPLLFEALSLLPHLGAAGDIGVHAEVEKHGLRCETLTADSTQALCDHLRDQGVSIDPGELETLKPYLSGEHVLIATWIASRGKLLEDFPDLDSGRPGAEIWPCILIQFPAEKAFFPLRPTSAYGDVKVPLRLCLSGFVKPQSAAPIVGQTRVRYYRLDGDNARDATRILGAEQRGEFDYTSIRLDVEASAFTADMWFVPTEPATMRFADAVLAASKWPTRIATFVALWLIMSYVCAGLAGLAVWRRWKRPALLGFWNMLTIGGMVGGLKRHSLVDNFGTIHGLDERGVRRRFIITFSLLFVVLSIVAQLALQTPLALS
jgi:hypothetical protein